MGGGGIGGLCECLGFVLLDGEAVCTIRKSKSWFAGSFLNGDGAHRTRDRPLREGTRRLYGYTLWTIHRIAISNKWINGLLQVEERFVERKRGQLHSISIRCFSVLFPNETWQSPSADLNNSVTGKVRKDIRHRYTVSWKTPFETRVGPWYSSEDRALDPNR